MILGYGNPIVDLTVELGEEHVLALGLTVGVDAPPIGDEDRQKVIDFCACHPAVRMSPGGSALNSIRVAQQCLGGGAAGGTGFIGAVGADRLG